jgi:integrase
MPRPATGQVITHDGPRGRTFAIRFRAYGKRRFVTLGAEAEGWTRAKAEDELRYVLGQVDRGAWKPDTAPEPPAELQPEPTFHVFASEWFERVRHELRPSTERTYLDELRLHLLPFFARHKLSQITIEEVDRYRAHKVREGVLAPRSINKTLTRLGQVLEDAVEYGHLERNPARGRRRRLKVAGGQRTHLDRAEHIAALLEAAGRLDAAAREDRRSVSRRALLATLTFAGLRISELVDLRWRDVDLANGWLRVRASKTDAGVRQIRLLPMLREELVGWKAQTTRGRPNDRVFPTATGGRFSESNVRRRILAKAVKAANVRAEQDDVPELPAGLTPHGLRHTFASVLVALGEDPRFVMDQLGHTDPAFTLRLYTHAMRRDDGERGRLRALVEGADWAEAGRSSVPNPQTVTPTPDLGKQETRREQVIRLTRTAGIEPATFGSGDRRSIP